MVDSLPKAEVEQVFNQYADEDGILLVENLYRVLNNLGLDNSPRDLCNVQAALRHLSGSKHNDGITFGLFHKWYKLETGELRYDANNELLVRRVIGHVKLPTRQLKKTAFVYGSKNEKSEENAGEVVLNWVSGTRSKSKEAGISLIKVNKQAVLENKTTSKEVTRYLKDHFNDKQLQKKKIVGRKKGSRSKDINIQYNSKESKMQEENMQEILFPNDTYTESNYVDTSGQRVKGKIPLPRPTKSSQLLATNASEARSRSVANKGDWKMSKFDKVSCKIQMGKP